MAIDENRLISYMIGPVWFTTRMEFLELPECKHQNFLARLSVAEGGTTNHFTNSVHRWCGLWCGVAQLYTTPPAHGL